MNIDKYNESKNDTLRSIDISIALLDAIILLNKRKIMVKNIIKPYNLLYDDIFPAIIGICLALLLFVLLFYAEIF